LRQAAKRITEELKSMKEGAEEGVEIIRDIVETFRIKPVRRIRSRIRERLKSSRR